MSFGVGGGDIVKVGELAYKIWVACSSAPAEFHELSRELSSIHITLRSLGEDASNPTSLLCRRGVEKKDELLQMVSVLEISLKEVEELLEKYKRLGLARKRDFWQRLGFSRHQLNELRDKLLMHLTAINSFYATLQSGSLSRIEVILEEMWKEIRRGEREPTILSVTSDPSNASGWQLLERELGSEGIAEIEVERYRSQIVSYLKDLVMRDTEGVTPSESGSIDGDGERESLEDFIVREKLRENDHDLEGEGVMKEEREDALRWASQEGHIDVPRYLLRANVDVRSYNAQKITALHLAAKHGHLEVCKILVDAGADVNALRVDSSPRNPILIGGLLYSSVLVDAAKAGKLRVVRYLLQNGVRKEFLINALHDAIKYEHHSIVRLLLDNRMSVEANLGGMAALRSAATLGSPSIVKYLLGRGAGPKWEPGEYEKLLVDVLESQMDREIRFGVLQALMTASPISNRRNELKLMDTLLDVAIRQNLVSMVKYLLTIGADPEAVGKDGSFPIFNTCAIRMAEESCLAIMGALVDAGANLDQASPLLKLTALHHAARRYSLKKVRFLLEKKAKPNVLDIFGTSALHFACMGTTIGLTRVDQVEVVKLLLAAGADPGKKAIFGEYSFYPQDIAIELENQPLVDILVPSFSRVGVKQKSHPLFEEGECLLFLIFKKKPPLRLMLTKSNSPERQHCKVSQRARKQGRNKDVILDKGYGFKDA